MYFTCANICVFIARSRQNFLASRGAGGTSQTNLHARPGRPGSGS